MAELVFGGPISELPLKEREAALFEIAHKVLEVISESADAILIPEITKRISERTSLSQKEVTFGIQFGVGRGLLLSAGPLGPVAAASGSSRIAS